MRPVSWMRVCRPRTGSPPRVVLAAALGLVVSGLLTARLSAMDMLEMMMGGDAGAPVNDQTGFIDKVIEQFTTASLYVEMGAVILLAMVLAAVVAYHPQTRRKASTLEEVQQPKTFIMYAMVGALVGHVVMLDRMMALVVFGIGGLLRFRTDVGEAKDTGRVILVTIIGICCGLGSFLVAVLATVFGWILIWFLERQQAGRLQVKNLTAETIPSATEAYRRGLQKAGCAILGERKNFLKGQVTFVFSAPSGFDLEHIEKLFEEVPKECRGVVDWNLA